MSDLTRRVREISRRLDGVRPSNPTGVDLETIASRVAALQAESKSVANITTAGGETYTAVQLAGGIITRDPNGLARTDTTDTAVAIIAAFGLSADGNTARCYLINTADAALEDLTLAGGTGVTIANAGQTIGQNEAALLLLRRTGPEALTLYIVGA